MKTPTPIVALLGMTATLPLVGCSAPSGSRAAEEDVSEVVLALTTVPADVRCIHVVATVDAHPPVLVTTTVVPGTTFMTLPLGRLPAGNGMFTGSAFSFQCNMISVGTTPDWIADPAGAVLQPGVVTTVELAFRRNNPVTTTVSFLENVVEISVGQFATYARTAEGAVKQWGAYGSGGKAVPDPVPGLTNAIQVTAGNGFACARRSDGTVGCWGRNLSGVLGPSIAIDAVSATPVTIALPGPATDLAAGNSHVCAAVDHTSSGTSRILCWGFNSLGQIGNNSTTNTSTPADVLEASRVFAGYTHTCAVNGSGTLFCWGGNVSGQIGDGTTTGRLVPTAVSGLFNTIDVALGTGHSCALRADFSLRCWGSNGGGQLGDGTTANRLSPTAVPSLIDARQIAAGHAHTCARRATGAAACWGSGALGELGDGSGENKLVPSTVPGLSGVTAVRTHISQHACAELGDRTVRCWGINTSGQIGDGTKVARPTPVAVPIALAAPSGGAGTFLLTIATAGNGTVSSSPAGISLCGGTGGDCAESYAAGTSVMLTATPGSGWTFAGWTGGCSGSTAAITVTMDQARTCTASFGASAPAAAPIFVGAGAGAEGTTSLSVPYPTGLHPSDLLVLQLGSRSPATTPTTPPAGFSHLDPGEWGSPSAYQRLYYKLATGSETGALAVTLIGTSGLPTTHVAVGRFYVFRGVALTAFTESPAGVTDSNGTLPGPTVVTAGAGRLAVAFISIDNNPPMAPFESEMGGNWTEPVGEYGSGIGGNFGLQLQIAPMPAGGTISGGEANFGGANDASICRAFALIGAGVENTGATCNDGLDNDGDGFVDCNDLGCAAFCGGGAESTAAACNDGLDNDSDGFVDCNDFSCSGLAGCP
jgi:uncharacterized repeat protein (TIGR02543 family)